MPRMGYGKLWILPNVNNIRQTFEVRVAGEQFDDALENSLQ